MEAYYANALDVTMLRGEQARIGTELRAIEARQAVIDDWQEVMDLALRFSTRCATAYRRGDDPTRRLFHYPVLDQVHVPEGRSSNRPTRSVSICSLPCPSSNTTMWWAVEDSNL